MKILCFTPNPCIDQNYLAPAADWGQDGVADSLVELASGKGVNWACNLGDLCVAMPATPPTLLNLVPIPDSVVPLYRDRLRQHGVQPIFVDSPDPVRRHLTLIARDKSLHLRLPGKSLSPATWLKLEESLQPGRLIDAGDILIVAGSFPPEAPLPKMRQILGKLRDAGVHLWLDLSGPPLTQLASEATVIKINEEEFRAWMRKEKRKTLGRTLANAVRALNKLTHLVVTCGADGAYLAYRTPGQSTPVVIHGKLAATQVLYPTGAGDCFGAALLWAFLLGRQCPDALRLALAAATCAVEKGPQNGMDPGDIRVRGAHVKINDHPR